MDSRDSREIGDKILRDLGVGAEALAAKRNLDLRLEGLGLLPSIGAPSRIDPGEELVRAPFASPGTRFAGGAIGAVLFDPEGAPPDPRVIPSSDVDELYSDALYEPSDMIAAQAVSALATTDAGGTEVRFNVKGYVHVGSGAIGVYWNRPLGANQGYRWVPMAPGLLIPYDPRQGLFIGSDNTGGITVGGVLTLSFYRLPEARPSAEAGDRDDRAGTVAGDRTAPGAGGDPGSGSGRFSGKRVVVPTREIFRTRLASRLGAVGSDMPAGAVITAISGGPVNGTDVTLGSFSDAGVGTQIYKIATNMPVGGAVAIGATILNAPPDNTDAVWVGETAALAVASNGGLNAAGQDKFHSPVGGKLFFLANTGTQILGARYRS